MREFRGERACKLNSAHRKNLNFDELSRIHGDECFPSQSAIIGRSKHFTIWDDFSRHNAAEVVNHAKKSRPKESLWSGDDDLLNQTSDITIIIHSLVG
jgi:hypothetical protein